MQGVRRARDPIEHVRTLILEHELAEPGDLKRMEKEIKKVWPHFHSSWQLHVMIPHVNPKLLVISPALYTCGSVGAATAATGVAGCIDGKYPEDYFAADRWWTNGVVRQACILVYIRLVVRVTAAQYEMRGCPMQDVQKQIEEAKESKAPPIEDLWNNIYLDPMVAFIAPASNLDACTALCVAKFAAVRSSHKLHID